MSKVVSANYVERDSKFRWLSRELNQRPSAAVAFRCARLIGVGIFESSEAEAGFGCRLVAMAEEIQILEGSGFAGSEGQQVEYHRARLIDNNNRPLISCRELLLTKNGDIFAIDARFSEDRGFSNPLMPRSEPDSTESSSSESSDSIALQQIPTA